ncbi:MAG: GNAT family N-acetyltransferase, partial [Actinobacteria bacterium]|nr:GNAT family N-acetyltransferase [Actinomycetota bacterium]
MRLQDFLRVTAARDREVVELPLFTAYFHRDEQLKYFNYAIPDGDVAPSEDDVARLRAAFRERDRLPRLEWIEEAAPRLASALEAAGLGEELRTPMMACSAHELAEPHVEG